VRRPLLLLRECLRARRRHGDSTRKQTEAHPSRAHVYSSEIGDQLLLYAAPLAQTCLAVTVKTQSGPVVLCRAEEDFEQRNAVAGVKSRLIRRDQFVAISISIYRIGPSSAAKAASGPASSAGPRTGTTPHIRYVAGSAGGYAEDDTTMIRE